MICGLMICGHMICGTLASERGHKSVLLQKNGSVFPYLLERWMYTRSEEAASAIFLGKQEGCEKD